MISMNKIRDILNEIKWDNIHDFTKIQIWYIHRGAPNDIRIISGSDIISIRKTILETTDSMIPHHRIFKITYGKKTLFDRFK
jgi:uncharacterized protein (UPF0248 family)